MKTTKENISKELDPKVFDGKVNKNVLYQAVRMYQANRRQGSASTKTRAHVSGGGRKPWRQKGTGRARIGSIRSPLWKGGGVVFGPHPKDYSYSLSKGIRNEALRASLNAKYNLKTLFIVDDVAIEKTKTKEFKKILSSLKIKERALFVLDKIDNNLKLASRNIKEVGLKRADDLTAIDVISFKTVVLTKPALSILTRRISKEI